MSDDKKWTQLRTKFRHEIREAREYGVGLGSERQQGDVAIGMGYRERAFEDALTFMDRIESRLSRKPRKSDGVRKGTP